MSNRKKEIIKTAILIVVGAICGYVYYINWGCVDNCTIRSNVYLMTAYGAVFGLLISLIIPMSWVEKIKGMFCGKKCEITNNKEDLKDDEDNNNNN